MNAIEIRNLTKNYGRKQVLRGLNMSVPEGSIYGFLGVNGAGKTTTLGILTGFLPRRGGTVSVRGVLSSLPQDAALYPDRSIRGQLALLARLSGVRGRRAGREAGRVLDLVQLGDAARSTPKKLSHGMRQRLSVAQALLGDPGILVLDEPTAGLDPKNSAELRRLIRGLGREKTVVLSSHLLPEVEEICSHVGVIHDGKMVFEGSVAELTGAGSHVRYRLSKSIDPAVLDGIGAIRSKEFDGEEMLLSVSFDDKQITVEEINGRIFEILRGRGTGIREITPGRRLEDEFLRLLR
ncbi:MAG: ABC transporter ATP-binding protein [PVC group bacterium]